MKNKIMLALLNPKWSDESRSWKEFPYTFGLLTAVLKDKYDIKILETNLNNLSVDEAKIKIKEYNPKFFGTTCMSAGYSISLHKMTSIAKSACPETKVIVGGSYATLLPEELMKDENIDFLIMGEGEYRFPELLNHIEIGTPFHNMAGIAYRHNDKIVINNVENYIQNLDDLPFPCYDNINFYDYANQGNNHAYAIYPKRFPYAITSTSRGCPFNCIFCCIKAIGSRKIRYRSSESVLKEIDWLVKKYKIKEIIFLDDNFFLDRERIKRICKGLIERKYDLEWKTVNAGPYCFDDEILELMKKSGCYQITLAIESGTEEGLKLLRKPFSLSIVKPVVKKAKSLGFELGGLFVIGSPYETWEQIRETFRFAEEIDLDYCAFNIATPLPKTELYRIAKENNLLTEDFDLNDKKSGGFNTGKITTNEFTPKELQILRAFEWDRINFKNDKKIAKIAKMTGLTLEEVNDWRKSTRKSIGTKVEYK